MSTFNGKSFTDPRNINLKGGSTGSGLIRWHPVPSGSPGNWATNPFGTTDYGLYINSSGQLVFSSTGSLTVLGTPGGGGSIPSFNAVYAVNQTLTVAGTTFKIDNATNDATNVVTVTDTGAGSGNLIQITNTGSGSDINGTSSTWGFSKAGAMTALTAVFAGTAGTTSLTMTLGNIVTSAGGLAMTKASDTATLSVTNNSNVTATQVAFAGSGTFSGSTTTSFFTITPSGLTTGTAVYLPVVAISTGKGLYINYAGTTSHTSGKLFQIDSAATAMTSTGRMMLINHTGVIGVNAILSEFISAATDETIVAQVTASGAITGSLLVLANASSLTGMALSIPNADSLTTGFGINVGSSSTALTTTGRLFLVSHTGTSTSTGTLAEITSAAADTTVISQVTATSTLTGTAFVVNIASVTVTGTGISVIGTALTTGVALRLASSGTGLTSGSLIRASTGTTGAIATNGVFSFVGTGAFTTTASTLGLFHVAGATTVTGTIMSILGGAQTSGIALNITDPGIGMTSGSLLRVISATAGAVATNGVVSFQASGAFTSTTIGFVNVIGSGVTAGTIVAIQASAVSQTVTTALMVTQSTVTTGYTGNLVQFTGSGTTSAGNVLAVIGVNTTAGNVVSITNASASQTGNSLLSVVQSGTTTAYTGAVVAITATTTTGTGQALLVTADGITTGGTAIKLSVAALTTGTGLLLTNGTSGITTGSLLSVTAGGTGTIETNGIVSLVHSGAYDSTSNAGFVNITANSTLTGTVLAVNATALTTGIGFFMPSAEAGLTGAGRYISIGGKFTIGKFGATVITGSALGTAALTLTSGDILASAGTIKSASPTGGIGYATGAGLQVTQTTTRSTSVAINAVCGTIQTDTTSLAAQASAEFTFTNTAIAVSDVVVVSIRSGSANAAGVAGTTSVKVVTVAAGSCIISVQNDSTTTAETGAIIINFAVIKAVTA